MIYTLRFTHQKARNKFPFTNWYKLQKANQLSRITFFTHAENDTPNQEQGIMLFVFFPERAVSRRLDSLFFKSFANYTIRPYLTVTVLNRCCFPIKGHRCWTEFAYRFRTSSIPWPASMVGVTMSTYWIPRLFSFLFTDWPLPALLLGKSSFSLFKDLGMTQW